MSTEETGTGEEEAKSESKEEETFESESIESIEESKEESIEFESIIEADEVNLVSISNKKAHSLLGHMNEVYTNVPDNNNAI